MRTVRTVLLAAATIMVAAATPASAQQSYPNRPVQLVVPVPPGGAADFIARTVSAKLADALGQPVVINNQGGAGGTIASRGVAKAEPDGYTLLLNSITTHGIGPHLYATLPYDPVTDFVPVILLAKLPLIMTVTASLPAKTVQDVVELAKAQPGQLAFASSGNGGAPHLAGELFKTITGTDLLHVPYRGSGPAVVDVVAGRIAIMFDAAPSLLPFVTADKLRPLAAASTDRHRAPARRADVRRARVRRDGHLALVRDCRTRAYAAGDRAAAQWRTGQDTRHAGRQTKFRPARRRGRRRLA